MQPRLHIVVETDIASLARHRRLGDVDGHSRMTSDAGKEPQDLISTELRNQMTSEVTIAKIGSTPDKSLLECLIVKFPIFVGMSGQMRKP